MNGYNKILLVAFILLIISYINETSRPPINNNLNIKEYIYIYLLRYFHLVIYLLSTFYLFFFMGYGKNLDIYIYLIIALFSVIGWTIFDSCWLSYIELMFYNINLEKVKTTFHPTFYSVFNEYYRLIMNISGILYFFTVTILLYHLKPIKVVYKLLYYVLFVSLFVYSIREKNRTIYYSSKNKSLLFIKNLYQKFYL
jgi:hypothetical protein